MRIFLLISVLLAAGCAERRFVNVGGSTGVPASRVERRAEQEGTTSEKAAQGIGKEMRATEDSSN